MDSFENTSTSKAYSSFGLLDDHLLEESPFNTKSLPQRLTQSKLCSNQDLSNDKLNPTIQEPTSINETEMNELVNEQSQFSDDVNDSHTDKTPLVNENQEDRHELSSRYFKALDINTTIDHTNESNQFEDQLSFENGVKVRINDEHFENNYSRMKEDFMKQTQSLLKSLNLTTDSFVNQTNPHVPLLSSQTSHKTNSIYFKSNKELLEDSAMSDTPKKDVPSGCDVNDDNESGDGFGKFKNFNFQDAHAAAHENLFTDKQLNFSCEFKSSEEILNHELEGDLSTCQTKDVEQSWSNSYCVANQPSRLQTSNLTLDHSSLDVTTKKVPVDTYFNRKSTFPSTFDVNNGDESLVNFKKEMDSGSKIKKQQYQVPNRDIDDDTQNNTLLETTNNDNFSFTINASDNGESIIKAKINDKPRINIKEIGNDLNKISKLLNDRKNTAPKSIVGDVRINLTNETLNIDSDESQSNPVSTSQQALSTNTSKNAKNKSKLTGSITSTPAKLNQMLLSSKQTVDNTHDEAKLPKSVSQLHLFNQESFISSIADMANANDVTLQSCTSSSSNESKKQVINKQHVKQKVEIQQTSPRSRQQQQQQEQIMASLASGFSNTSTNSLLSNVSNTSNGVLPVAFLPANAVIPFMMKCFEDMSKLDSNNQNFTNVTKNFFSSMMNANSTVDNSSTFDSKRTSFQHLPRIELDKYIIDFGQIAEGCQDKQSLIITTIDDDYDVSNQFIIEINENSFKIDSKSDELCSQLRRIFSFQNESSQQIRLRYKKYQELHININTCGLKVFNMTNQEQKPINIQAQLLVYFNLSNSNRKYLLNKVDLKLQLGFVRLKTSMAIDSLDFHLDKYHFQDVNKIKFDIPQSSLKRSLPVSNAGNIPCTLDCYFLEDVSLCGHKIHIEKQCIQLNPTNKAEPIELELIRSKGMNITNDSCEHRVNTKFIVQVKPNGFRYEMPLSLTMNEINLSESVRVNATRTSIHFAPSNHVDIIDELQLMNPHSFNVKCTLKCSTLNNPANELFVLVNHEEIELKANKSECVQIKFKASLVHESCDSLFIGNLRITACLSTFNIKLFAFSGKSRVLLDGVTQTTPFLDDTRLKLQSNSIKYYSSDAKNLISIANSEIMKAFVKILYFNDDCGQVVSSKNGQLINNQSNKIQIDTNSQTTQNIMILAIDHHIFNYAFESIKENRPQNSMIKQRDTFNLDSLIYFDLFGDYLLLNNLADSATLKRLSDANFGNMTQSFCTLNSTTDNSLLIQKSKVRPSDLMKFFKSQISYFLVQMPKQKSSNLFAHPHLPPVSMLKTSSKRLTSSSSCLKAEQDSWSMDRTEVHLNDRQMELSVILFNHTNKDLLFKAIYQTNCLELLPSSGSLNSKSQKQVNIHLKKECYSKLPWMGTVTFICDKIQKDFRIHINSTSNPSTNLSLSRNTTSLSTGSLNSMCSSYMTNKSLEQGSLVADNTQQVSSSSLPLVDSNKIPLTPLINASLLPNNNNNNNSTIDGRQSVKVVRSGNDAFIIFTQYGFSDQATCGDLIFTNTSKDHVKWKTYSTAPPILKCEEDGSSSSNNATDGNLMKSLYPVFTLKPNSGVLAPKATQSIRIEFYPRRSYGVFTQQWEMDVRADDSNRDSLTTQLQAAKDLNDSYNCKLVLNGTLVPSPSDLSLSSNSLTNSLPLNPNQQSHKRSLPSASLPLRNSMRSSAKENNDPDVDLKKRVKLKTNVIEFPLTDPGELAKESLLLENSDDKVVNLTIIKLLGPFYCKHTTAQMSPKHFVRIPIEFRPTQQGDYVDKVIIKTDANDVPLTCVIRGKCKKTK